MKTSPPSAAKAKPAQTYHLADMHCHLDRMANAEEVADKTARRGIALFCTTITPADAKAAQARFALAPNIRVGVGLHPWWLADGSCDGKEAARAALLAASSRFIGEVGLDFSERYSDSFPLQGEAFELIMRTCAERPQPGRIISLHAVRSASAVLDILERFSLTRSASCIFHWFSGTSGELARARKLGCFFSVNEHMLRSKRGREYARQIPEEQLLLETDAPPHLDSTYSAEELENSLMKTLAQLADLRGRNQTKLATAIATTSSTLLGL